MLTNRSLWRNFPMIRNARWVKDNIVLLGDAKATAHFSIGSGTKLAMEDAIALHDAFTAEGSVDDALAAFETDRRDEVERTQHSADVVAGLVRAPQALLGRSTRSQFAFGVMTRAEGDHLRQPPPPRAGLRRAPSTGISPWKCASTASTCRSTIRRRRCSSRSGCATWCSATASSSRRCACTRPRTACPTTGTSSTTARARSAAPASSSPR